MVHVFSHQEITNERFFEILFILVNVVVKRVSIGVHICNLNVQGAGTGEPDVDSGLAWAMN